MSNFYLIELNRFDSCKIYIIIWLSSLVKLLLKTYSWKSNSISGHTQNLNHHFINVIKKATAHGTRHARARIPRLIKPHSQCDCAIQFSPLSIRSAWIGAWEMLFRDRYRSRWNSTVNRSNSRNFSPPPRLYYPRYLRHWKKWSVSRIGAAGHAIQWSPMEISDLYNGETGLYGGLMGVMNS